MSEYEIRFHKLFLKDFDGLEKAQQEIIVKKYKKILENPEHGKHLKGPGNCYTVRIENLRLVYAIIEKTVWVLIVDKRGSVYEEYLKRLYSLDK